jgi:hypothetical protein
MTQPTNHWWICFWLAMIWIAMPHFYNSGITVTDNRSCSAAPLSVEKVP